MQNWHHGYNKSDKLTTSKLLNTDTNHVSVPTNTHEAGIQLFLNIYGPVQDWKNYTGWTSAKLNVPKLDNSKTRLTQDGVKCSREHAWDGLPSYTEIIQNKAYSSTQ